MPCSRHFPIGRGDAIRIMFAADLLSTMSARLCLLVSEGPSVAICRTSFPASRGDHVATAELVAEVAATTKAKADRASLLARVAWASVAGNQQSGTCQRGVDARDQVLIPGCSSYHSLRCGTKEPDLRRDTKRP